MILQELFSRFNCGNTGLELSIFEDGQKLLPTKTDCNCAYERGRLQIHCEYGQSFTDDLYLEFAPEAKELELKVRRIFRNVSGQSRNINELCATFGGITFGEKPRDDYFYHAENPRIYEIMTFPVDYRRTTADAKDSNFDFTAGNRWADPGVVSERIGRSPYQPFPAILLSNYNSKHGLVHGTLSQKICYHNYLVSHEDTSVKLEIFSSFKCLDALELGAGKFITDEWYMGTTDAADDVEEIFEKYLATLRKVLPPMFGAKNTNRYTMNWGSWNDGLYRNISEELLLKEARYLKDNFPTVEWVQVDDGYEVLGTVAHGLGVPYEKEAGIDKKKFPQGMRHYTDEIRKIGLRPAIWIGGFCPKYTPIYKEHPEWFIDYDYRVESSAPLDVSQPEVREYQKYALDTLLLEYGFEGVKQDFWSYAYEDSHNLYRGQKDQSGYQWRDWWLKEFRKRMPDDGYFQTGCDIVQGNPFLGEFYNNYRYGMDIGDGSWESIIFTFTVGVACFALHTGDLIVPNSDSVGLLPGLNDDEMQFCINYCLITRSMVEIAGKLSESPNHPRLKMLKKIVCCPNNGADVHFAKYDYRNHSRALPEIYYFNTPHFSIEGADCLPVRTVALFNTKEDEYEIRFTQQELKLAAGKYLITNVWTGKTEEFSGGIGYRLKPHTSMLLTISRADGIQVLDANFKMLSARVEGSTLLIENDYKVPEAELYLNKAVKSIKFNGKPITFQTNGHTVTFAIPEKNGMLAIE